MVKNTHSTCFIFYSESQRECLVAVRRHIGIVDITCCAVAIALKKNKLIRSNVRDIRIHFFFLKRADFDVSGDMNNGRCSWKSLQCVTVTWLGLQHEMEFDHRERYCLHLCLFCFDFYISFPQIAASYTLRVSFFPMSVFSLVDLSGHPFNRCAPMRCKCIFCKCLIQCGPPFLLHDETRRLSVGG